MLPIAILTFSLVNFGAAATDWRDIVSNDTDIMIVSDVDDILRVTELWNPKRAIDNIFHQPFEPVADMPALYHEYNDTFGGHIHFTYVTDALKSFDKSYTRGLSMQYVSEPRVGFLCR